MRSQVLVLAASGLMTFGAQAATPTVEELYELIKAQQAEIAELKKSTSEQQRVVIERLDATAAVVEQTAFASSSKASKTTLGGYGEHHFNHIDGKEDEVDAHRFVLFIGHEFNDKLRMFSELEVEHGIAGEGQPGEVELEQAYIEWDFIQNHSVKIGQFLIPVGTLNETHEPDTFYGTERNNVEKNIIPTTWWETGVMFTGEIAPGLSYDAGVHSGLATAEGGKVRDGRQKSAKAVAEELAYTARVKYTGVAGLELAASAQFQKDITQGLADTDGDNDALLLTLLARYQMGDFTVSGLLAEWDINGSAFEANGRDEQSGWVFEASYKVLPKLGVFVRQSAWDNEAGINTDSETERMDLGVNYWLHQNVVLKADFGFEEKANVDTDSLNFGVGWSF